MWPWGHAAVGYVLYSGFVRYHNRQSPNGVAVLALGLGTQLPDLIDKPLAWTLSVLPTGRSLAHSLLTVTFVLAVGWLALHRTTHKRSLTALGIGWVAHSFTDVVGVFLGGNVAYANFLLWPLLHTPPYETRQSFAAHVGSIEFTPYFLLQLGVTVIAFALWRQDGYPGITPLLRLLPQTQPKST